MIKILIFIALKVFADEFRVALPMLPDVHPTTNQINSGNYIGSHIYYPLFASDKNGLNSFFLDLERTKAIDNEFKQFQFCLKSGLYFSDGSSIELVDLFKSLKAMSIMYPQLLNIESISMKKDNCLLVKLKESHPGLFVKLTGIASTVLKNGGDAPKYPTGIGPYQIISKNENELIVQSTLKIKPRFDKIKFTLIKKNDEDVSQFTDINQLPPSLNRDKLFKGVQIDAPSLKVYSFVLNVKDSLTRSAIRSLIEKENWPDAFGLSLVQGKYFLPWLNGNYDIHFLEKNIRIKNRIPFLVPDFYDVTKIEKLLRDKELGKMVYIKVLPAKEFASWAFSGKEYIGIMGFDSSGSISSLEGDFSVYFESFYSRTNRIVTYPLLRIQDLMKHASNRKLSNQERLQIMLEAEKYLSDSNYIHPIGKVKRVFLYPSSIVISEWYDFFSGIPKIDKVQ